jgi:hypothetical protein
MIMLLVASMLTLPAVEVDVRADHRTDVMLASKAKKKKSPCSADSPPDYCKKNK